MSDVSTIAVTYDGDTHWLACYATNDDGALICAIDSGDTWDDLVANVAAHQAEHGCDRG